MPFLVSGTIKNQTFDNQVVQPKKLAELFGVNFKDKLVSFRMAGAFTRYDQLNQMERNAPGFLLNPTITGTYEGEQVQIRYFKTRRTVQRGKSGDVELMTPHRVSDFRSKSLELVSGEEFELALFFYLHEKHAKSPLFSKNSQAYYEIYSKQADAQRDNEQTEVFIDVFTSLKDTPREVLLIKAKGLQIKGERIQIGKDMSQAELVRAIASMAMKYPKEFPEMYSSSLAEFNGTIEVAIDLGVIVKGKSNGIDAWKFADQYGGEAIAAIRGPRDPKFILRDEVNKNFDDLFIKIRDIVNGRVDSVAEADIEKKMAKLTSSRNPEAPTDAIGESLSARFNELKESGLITIDKAVVYVAGEKVGTIRDDYKKLSLDYIAAHPELLKPA